MSRCTELVGDVSQAVNVQVDKDLKNFKEFIEHREAEMGGWRGVIKPGGQVESGPTAESGMNP